MKIALLLSALTCASAFVAPRSHPSVASMALSSTAEEEAVSTGMGAKAIAALTSEVKTVFSSEDIDKILPHRYPFALVDKVVEYVPGKVS